MRVKLEVMSGPMDGHIFQFNHPVELGREGHLAIKVDRFLSRRHLRLEPSEVGVVLEDLKSTNGTFLNGERVTGRVELANGCLFRAGKTWLEISW
jgi:hypothetical protein